MKVLKNYLFSSSYQLLLVIVPFITTPYLSRVLGSGGIGLNTFTASIVGYFVLIATLGTNLYGNREIAYYQNNKERRSKVFWEISFLSWGSSIVTLLAFLIFLLFIKQYKFLYLLQGIAILSTMLDISWYFMGVEKFKVPVLRNFIFKILTVILIFAIVHRPSDLYKYVAIMMFGGLIGNLSLWPYLRKEIYGPNFKKITIKRHVLPSIMLFLPFASLSIYAYGQKTLIGLFDSISHSGFFFQSDNLIKIVLSLITSVGTVMLPHMSGLKARGDFDGIKKNLKKSLNISIGISSALCFGIAGVSIKFAPFFFGNQFKLVGSILFIESFSLFFMAASNIFQTHYFLPLNKLNRLTLSMVYGAIVNLLLNDLLIPIFGVIGATFSVVFTELLMSSYQFYFVKVNLKYDKLLDGIWKYLVAGIVMFIVVFEMNLNFDLKAMNRK